MMHNITLKETPTGVELVYYPSEKPVAAIISPVHYVSLVEAIKEWEKSQQSIPIHPSSIEAFKKLDVITQEDVVKKIVCDCCGTELICMDANWRVHAFFKEREPKEDISQEELKDRLFKLANNFAINKHGDIVVRLHSIHNLL